MFYLAPTFKAEFPAKTDCRFSNRILHQYYTQAISLQFDKSAQQCQMANQEYPKNRYVNTLMYHTIIYSFIMYSFIMYNQHIISYSQHIIYTNLVNDTRRISIS